MELKRQGLMGSYLSLEELSKERNKGNLCESL